ncbi:MAG: hypothetical protein QOE77_821 [Blastocatellia bacterium]|jgi:hypothetical protein|nr:hypothetical protein [Blastocatellia bacterium]
MYNKLFVWLKNHLGFYGNPKIRRVMVLALLAISLLSSFLAFNSHRLPESAISSIVFSGLLITFLCVDSVCYVASVLVAALGKRLSLVRKIDSELDAAICRAEDESINVEGNESDVKRLAEKFFDDFENKRPFPRIAAILLWRTFLNFLLTALCFGFVTMGLVRIHMYCGSERSPYRHACFEERSFAGVNLHLLYYHLVIFQSLGDGNHAPETLDAQAVAIVETFLAFLYMILILGGILSIAMFVQSELTPEKLTADLLRRLRDVSSGESLSEGLKIE